MGTPSIDNQRYRAEKQPIDALNNKSKAEAFGSSVEEEEGDNYLNPSNNFDSSIDSNGTDAPTVEERPVSSINANSLVTANDNSETQENIFLKGILKSCDDCIKSQTKNIFTSAYDMNNYQFATVVAAVASGFFLGAVLSISLTSSALFTIPAIVGLTVFSVMTLFCSVRSVHNIRNFKVAKEQILVAKIFKAIYSDPDIQNEFNPKDVDCFSAHYVIRKFLKEGKRPPRDIKSKELIYALNDSPISNENITKCIINMFRELECLHIPEGLKKLFTEILPDELVNEQFIEHISKFLTKPSSIDNLVKDFVAFEAKLQLPVASLEREINRLERDEKNLQLADA